MESLFHIQGDADADLAPLFLIHAVSGFALPYLSLGPLSSEDEERPVYGLSCPTYEHRTYCLPQSLDDVAHEYVARIQKEHPQGPYILGGWSMGGMIATKMATILQEQDEEVLHVILIDSANPQGCPQFVDDSERSAVGEYTYNAYSKRTGLPGLEDMVDEEFSDYESDENNSQPDDDDDDDEVDVTEYLPRMQKHIYNSWDMINRAGQGGCLAEGLESPVTLVKCESLAAPPPGLSDERIAAIRHRFDDKYAGWEMDNVKTVSIEAQHDNVFDGVHVGAMTEILRETLSGVDG